MKSIKDYSLEDMRLELVSEFGEDSVQIPSTPYSEYEGGLSVYVNNKNTNRSILICPLKNKRVKLCITNNNVFVSPDSISGDFDLDSGLTYIINKYLNDDETSVLEIIDGRIVI